MEPLDITLIHSNGTTESINGVVGFALTGEVISFSFANGERTAFSLSNDDLFLYSDEAGTTVFGPVAGGQVGLTFFPREDEDDEEKDKDGEDEVKAEGEDGEYENEVDEESVITEYSGDDESGILSCEWNYEVTDIDGNVLESYHSECTVNGFDDDFDSDEGSS